MKTTTLKTTIYRHVNGYEWVWENLAGNGVAKSFEAARLAGIACIEAVFGK